MPQREVVPTPFRVEASAASTSPFVHLEADLQSWKVSFSLEPIKPGILRTSLTTPDHPLPPFPSAERIKPNGSHFAVQESTSTSKTIRSGDDVEATVSWSSGIPLVSVGFVGEEPLHADLPHRSYALDGRGSAHYSCYHRESLHIGLGEKAAPMDISGRSFELSATDCFGYDVHRTDPMYKHIPLVIRATPRGVVATFSTSHSRGFYSVGGEMDGMWGRYKVYRQDFGGLEIYTLIGRTLQDVVTLYADVVGYPQLVPRWAFGYLAGGYKYAMLDDPRACDALMEFTEKLEKYDIPCSGFQLSSGYTVADTEPKNRHVFHWNLSRFPDPKGFVQAYRKKGIRLIANVKPYLVASHPDYKRLAEAGGLFQDPATGKSAVARLWSAGGGTSGEGGHVDFTSQAGYDFWMNGIKEMREIGIDCPWNDNNEYVIPSDDWELKLDAAAVQEAVAGLSIKDGSQAYLGLWGRYIHTELMGKSSAEGVAAAAPHERPFVLTRAATAGTMKYCASSWSGDNVTSWAGMRGANALSLTAGMCLLQCYGHDIGGFEGPQPSPELLLRWVQLGCHSPRFAINCFKTLHEADVGDVIEPWMYPQILPQLRAAICRRYQMIPYLYSLHLQSHLRALPPQRWVGWGYENDDEAWKNKTLTDGETQYWLGDALMIGGVYDPGATEARIYLPKRRNDDLGFLNTNPPYQYMPAGQWHSVASPWDQSIPILARIGACIPIGRDKQTVAPGDKVNEASLPADDWRGVEIFPPPEELSDGREFVNEWYEDDGISPAKAKIATFTLKYSATATQVQVSFLADTTEFYPPWLDNGLTIVLPVGDARTVVCTELGVLERRRQDSGGRQRFHLLSEQRRRPNKL